MDMINSINLYIVKKIVSYHNILERLEHENKNLHVLTFEHTHYYD
ncbi:hypothetical protein X474_03355 [Dethiosulfatarculus sandiegensis]|uniref:Uncharacterized protein n=1 Tax=Dethiosulfatarculus sandiegensis TaxID=1429043 RepID=A0A0D2JI39_9BACT|nr:hypothetical protein X474_03355 [Dethiosulfatarculus sandiegensis]